jgi:hypothetical protein
MDVLMKVMAILSQMDWAQLILAIEALLAALVMLFVLIPGPHPEDWLQTALDWIKKLSKK